MNAAPSAVHHATVAFSKEGLYVTQLSLRGGGTQNRTAPTFEPLCCLQQKRGDKVVPEIPSLGKTARLAAADQRERLGNNRESNVWRQMTSAMATYVLTR